MIAQIEEFFEITVQCGVLLMECVGVTVLLVTTFKSIWGCLRRDPHVRLTLAKGIALALEFKLGGEVLRTVIVREWSEMAISSRRREFAHRAKTRTPSSSWQKKDETGGHRILYGVYKNGYKALGN